MNNWDNYGGWFSRVGRPSTLDKARVLEAKRKARKIIHDWATMYGKDAGGVKSQLTPQGQGEETGMDATSKRGTLDAILKTAPDEFKIHVARWYKVNKWHEVEVHNEPMQFGIWRTSIETYLTKCVLNHHDPIGEIGAWPWEVGT